MKILVDMNLSPLWIDTFRKNSLEAIHWSEIGDPRAEDRVLMSWGREHGYIVYVNPDLRPTAPVQDVNAFGC